ncbi:MAG TPA: transposase [Dehalococcoidia bacterium]|nr:transposase [Dehalococcoidia bacterium]
MAERASRHSIRLVGYDYARAGAYFVTLCTQGRLPLFGDVFDGTMHSSSAGEAVVGCWQWLGEQYPYVSPDAFVVMPDHRHGILVIANRTAMYEPCAVGRGGAALGGSQTAPTERLVNNQERKPLGRLIGSFKTVSTKRVNDLRGEPGAQLWQRNYYGHIIRSERTLNRIRQHIIENPARWHGDPDGREAFREVGIKPTLR